MTDTTQLPEATNLRIINWASNNAQTQWSSFSETRYCGLIDGAKHEATHSLKLIQALEKIGQFATKPFDQFEEIWATAHNAITEYNQTP